MRSLTSLDSYVSAGLDAGQHQLASIMRTLVYNTAPDLADDLDFSDDVSFLEPLLFAYFNGAPAGISLARILAPYLSGPALPGSSLSSDPAARSISIYPSLPPLFGRFFLVDAGGGPGVSVTGTMPHNQQAFEAALDVLREHCRPCFATIIKAVRTALVYEADRPYSFAAMPAHGAIFLNAGQRGSRPYFLEDIVHQSSHVVFNAVTVNQEEFLRVSPDEPLAAHTTAEVKSSVYGAFHGLFTQTTINRCFRACRLADTFSGAEAHEIEGRLSDNMKRFRVALGTLGKRELYTEQGWWLFEQFSAAFEALYEEEARVIERYDNSYQDYVFSYAKFVERNPFRSFSYASRPSGKPNPRLSGAGA